MRAITLHQPYATLIAVGAKKIETRDYAAPQYMVRFGDTIAIHAAKQKVKASGLTTIEYQLITKILGPTWAASMPYGAVVATAKITDVKRVNQPADAPLKYLPRKPNQGAANPNPEFHFGGFAVGRWMWILEDVEPVDPPISARGYQGWWEWDDRELKNRRKK